MDIPKRFTERSGPSLPAWEQIHIYKEPPKSVFTRKKERVSEADITWMIRPDGPSSDPSRINQSIGFYSRGVNPSVEVNYSNLGAGGSKTHSLQQNQAGSLYKVEVVRPPLYPVESLLPLSRPRTHQNKTVETNPGLPGNVAQNYIADDVDKTEIYNAIIEEPTGPGTIQATAYYKIEAPTVMSARYAISNIDNNAYDIFSTPSLPTTANIADNSSTDASAKVKQEMLLGSIRPNFQIVIYDPSSQSSNEVKASIAEKMNIAVQASVGKPIIINREDGTFIKLKNYNWTTVNSHVGYDHLVLTIQDPDIKLERNTPLFAVQPSVFMPTDINEIQNSEYELEGKICSESNINPNISSDITMQKNANYNFDSKIVDNGQSNLGLSSNITQLKNINYSLFGKTSIENVNTNVSLGMHYNEENSRYGQDKLQLEKQVYHTNFGNLTSYIPMYNNQNMQIKTRDNTRNLEAHKNMYSRVFN